MCSIGIQVSVTTISASSSTAVTPFGRHPEGRDHDEMRSGHGIPQGDLPLEASRHAAMQVLAEQEGVVRQVLDDELVARAGRGELPHLADEQHEPARAGAGRPDPADRAQVPLGQLRFALGREHFRDVEHLRKRRAFGDLVVSGLQEVLADDEPVALAGHALRPAIEPGFLPEVMQRCFERELGGIRLDAVALTRSRRRRRFPAGARETEAEPQDGDAGISILLDGAPDHIPEARELWWRFIRLASGIVLDAGAGHALWDELARDPRDVHRSRRFAAETQRPDPARVRIRQGGPQLGIIGAQGGATNLKPSRHRGRSVAQHGQAKQGKSQQDSDALVSHDGPPSTIAAGPTAIS